MADYDSDSSEGEFTETNVLLGYASKDAEEDTISKLGGHPEWLESDKPPSAALARCKVCKDLMVLLLQLNGELPERFPGHERRVYVFACRRQTCRRKAGSIRALRGVRVWKDEEEPQQQQKQQQQQDEAKESEEEKKKKEKGDGPGLGEALFGAKPFGEGASSNPFASNANPFSSSLASTSSANPFASPPAASSSPSQLNPFSAQPAVKPASSPEQGKTMSTSSSATLSKTFAETLSFNNTTTTPPAGPPPAPEPWPETSSLPPPYPVLFLADADYETLDPTPAAGKLPADVRISDADAPEPSALDREAFESAMDATFQKFADRLAQNPDQVIRYEFAGAPLLYSKTDAVGELLGGGGGGGGGRGMPACANCGARRVFEVQLTPNAIAELEADDLSLDGMEWGTVIVGVCEKDCVPRGTAVGEAGYLEEWAGVQWEELAKNK